MKNLAKILQDLRSYIVPFFLVILWISISALTTLLFRSSLTVLRHDHKDVEVILAQQSGKLMKGKIFKGEFVAVDNYLGSVGIWIHNNSKEGVKEDEIVFRIKEKGASKWYYVHAYGGGQFRELENFPFGFSPIVHSYGKVYEYELISKSGTNNNALTFSLQNPPIITWYQFPKKQLLTDKVLLAHFLIAKAEYGLSSISLVLILFIYFLFFGFYVFSSLLYDRLKEKALLQKVINYYKGILKILNKNPLTREFVKDLNKIQLFDSMLLWAYVIDVFFVQEANIFLFMFLLITSVGRILYRSYSIGYVFLYSLFLFILCMICLSFSYTAGAEKAAVWLFMFLTFGVFRAIVSGKFTS